MALLLSAKDEARITLGDSIVSAMIKLADGNPGALLTLAGHLTGDPWADWMQLLFLEDAGLRGPSIWLARHDLE